MFVDSVYIIHLFSGIFDPETSNFAGFHVSLRGVEIPLSGYKEIFLRWTCMQSKVGFLSS